MIRNTVVLGTALTLLIIFSDKSHSIDFRSLADQSIISMFGRGGCRRGFR